MSETIFLRLLETEDKAAGLLELARQADSRVFAINVSAFGQVPGSPMAYWVRPTVLSVFQNSARMNFDARRGPSTCDDFRYLRLSWEVGQREHGLGLWMPFAKGGAFSRYYADVYMTVDWEPRRSTFLGFFGRPGRWVERPESLDCFFRPGLTWPLRTQGGLSLRVLPGGCIFSHKGPTAFVADDQPNTLLALLAVTNSAAFRALVALQMAFGSYEVGVIQNTPVPDLSPDDEALLAGLAKTSWSLKRRLDTVNETSHALLLPALLSVSGASLTCLLYTSPSPRD